MKYLKHLYPTLGWHVKLSLRKLYNAKKFIVNHNEITITDSIISYEL